MTTMTYQITSLTVVYSTVYSDADQRKHQSSASLAFVWGIYLWPGPVNSQHKGPVTRKMFPFDDVIMDWQPERDINHTQQPRHIPVSNPMRKASQEGQTGMANQVSHEYTVTHV